MSDRMKLTPQQRRILRCLYDGWRLSQKEYSFFLYECHNPASRKSRGNGLGMYYAERFTCQRRTVEPLIDQGYIKVGMAPHFHQTAYMLQQPAMDFLGVTTPVNPTLIPPPEAARPATPRPVVYTTTIGELLARVEPSPRHQLDSALEHASHAWRALQGAGLAPETVAWPPEASQGGVGSPSYHVAALISYVKRAYDQLAKSEGESS